MTNDHAHNQHQKGKHGARVSCLTAAAVLSLFAWAPNPFILQHPCYSISRPPSFGRCPAPGPAARRLRCPSSQAAAARRPPTAASPTAPGLPGLPRRPPACGKKQAVASGQCQGPRISTSFPQHTGWAGARDRPRTDFFIIRRNVVAVPKVAHAAIHAHAAHAAHAAHSTCVEKHSVRDVPPWPPQRAAVLVPPVLACRAWPPQFDALAAAHRNPSHHHPCRHPCHRPRQSRPCTPCPPPHTTC